MNMHTWLKRNDRWADDEWSLPKLNKGDTITLDKKRLLVTNQHEHSADFEQTVTVETKISRKAGGSRRRNPNYRWTPFRPWTENGG